MLDEKKICSGSPEESQVPRQEPDICGYWFVVLFTFTLCPMKGHFP